MKNNNTAHLIRDKKTKAIINTSDEQYRSFIEKRSIAIIQKTNEERINTLEIEVCTLKAEIAEIRKLLACR